MVIYCEENRLGDGEVIKCGRWEQDGSKISPCIYYYFFIF